MLKIKTKLLSVTAIQDGQAKTLALKANAEAEATQSTMRQESCEDGCDEHTDEISVLTVVALRDGTCRIEKTDFCCEAFEDKYEFAEPRRVRLHGVFDSRWSVPIYGPSPFVRR